MRGDTSIQYAETVFFNSGTMHRINENKLRSSSQWETIKTDQDALALLEEIRSITFRFEEQTYPILSLHNTKAMFYAFRQFNQSNAKYLQKFRNLVDIATSLGGNLHDEAVSRIVTLRLHAPLTDPRDTSLTVAERVNIQEVEKEQYLALALISQSDKKRFGRLQEELENDYTKGNNN